jgi:hypothetical protein
LATSCTATLCRPHRERPVVEKSKKRPKLRNPAQADCRAPAYHRAFHGDFGSLTGRERTVMTDISRRAIVGPYIGGWKQGYPNTENVC